MPLSYPQVESYWQYIRDLNQDFPNFYLSEAASDRLDNILACTNWENPQSSLDWNNLAVISLIAAEHSTDLLQRENYINMAKDSLNQGAVSEEHPLCAVHFVLIYSTIGDMDTALPAALSIFTNLLQPAFNSLSNSKNMPWGLVYLPPLGKDRVKKFSRPIKQIIESENGYMQALLLLSESLWVQQISFFRGIDKKRLYIAQQVLPNIAEITLKLGVLNLIENEFDSILYIHKALQLLPNHSAILQSLYLGYRSLGHLKNTADWWIYSQNIINSQNSSDREWQWLKLPVDSPFTYVPFEKDLLMAVQPSFQSIVTSVLLAEGDWFEPEMEFWRSWIKTGMTVIDVGANAGVYTFSAAHRVGKEGIVIAIEPLAQCVEYLKETCRVNEIDWVKMWTGAASDRNGKLKLKLSSASELNEVINEEEFNSSKVGDVAEVLCFTLDTVIEQEGLEKVDFLKIDAEGHEMQVLRGSDRLLSEFQPVILYENIASDKADNGEVANFLKSKGYQLFTYRPFLQQLIPVESNANWKSSLNIIALPPNFGQS